MNKQERIKKAQDVKNKNIAYFNSLNTAVGLLGTMDYDEDRDVKEFLGEWRDYFYDEWKKWGIKEFGGKEKKGKRGDDLGFLDELS